MRIELRDKPEEKKEPVAKLWLEYDKGRLITLYYQIEGRFKRSLAFFDTEGASFHVFDDDLSRLGYRLTSTKGDRN